ncbi:RNA polymerase sigma factor [Bacillus spongiae]|uniref:RNA polymerase sigma factor n=1 Tax=Bacillus spongiae TaxID=2683610 RepID=A0ABU8HJV7_9BACI
MNQDLVLIEQIKKKGSEVAANELVKNYYREIYHYVYKQTLDQEQSLDLTQEIFINMLQALYRFEGKRSSFRTWLYKIATYKVVDYFRSRHYKVQKLSVEINDMEFGNEKDFTNTLLQKEEVKGVIDVINGLETSFQQIIRLKLFTDYTFQDIAETLQIPESTVKTRYYRSLKHVKAELKEADKDA